MKNPKKSILIIGPFPLPISGVSLANQVVYDGLKSNENHVVGKINTSFSSFDEDLGSLNLKKVWFYLKVQLFAYKIFRYDIIYITPGQTFYGVLKYGLFILCATLSRKQIIQHIHGNFIGKQFQQLTGIKKALFKTLMSFTDKGIVLSDSLKPNFRPFITENKIFTLKNFVIEDLFLDDIEIQEKKYDHLQILYLSNLMNEKGIIDVLKAFKELENKGIPYSAKVAGNIDSNNKTKIDILLRDLKYTEYVGVADLKLKRDLFKWSNVFVLPTYYQMEGQPISILEAMGTGNLILTTNHAGIPDIFEEGKNGYYVEKRNPNSIFNQLTCLNQDYSFIRKVGELNIKVAKTKYRISDFLSNFILILEK